MTVRKVDGEKIRFIGGVGCAAPMELFSPEWDDVPVDLQDSIPPGGLGCEGGARPGYWCSRCPWEETRLTVWGLEVEEVEEYRDGSPV